MAKFFLGLFLKTFRPVFSQAPIAEILGKKPSDCRKEFQQPKTAPDAEHSKPLAVGGGWRIRKADAKRRVPCEIDAIDGLTADAFVIDYLSVQRPVLVKNALSSPAWRQLLPLWTREEIERRLGHIEVAVGTIPYAERFEKEVGWKDEYWDAMRQSHVEVLFSPQSNTTTIDEYIDMMDDLYAAHVDGEVYMNASCMTEILQPAPLFCPP